MKAEKNKVKMKPISLQDKLFLHDPLGNKFSVQAVQIALTQQEDDIQKGILTECRLKYWVNWDIYQQIESLALFNFDGQLRGAMSNGDFLPELEVEITTLLRPDLLDELAIPIHSAATIAAYLEKLSQEEQTHQLLSTESWILLSAQQQQPQGVVQYRTVWDYLDWGAIASDNLQIEIDDWLLKAISNFIKDATFPLLTTDTANSEINPQLVESSTQLIETVFTLAPSLFSNDKSAKEQFVNEIAHVFTESLQAQLSEQLKQAFDQNAVELFFSLPNQNLSEIANAPQPTSANTIFNTALHFFQAENWTINQLPDQPILHLNFEGESGQWQCYAQAREIQQQFIFYSLLPIKAPESKRQAVAEYITRVNYNIIIGNFEFDFSDGEIRYKTSICVEETHLNLALIRQIVYSNLLNTDKYFPGILQVIAGDASPEEALAAIEIDPS